MKHICFFIGSVSNNGGTERITISLANHLMENGYEVSIISMYSAENSFFEIDKKIQSYSLFKKPKNYTFYLPLIIYFLYKKIKDLEIDIIINSDVILSLFSLPVKFFNRKLKVISWEHFNYKTNLGIRRRDCARMLSKKYANAIVTLTEQDKGFYMENGVSRASIICIPNYLDNIPSVVSKLNNKIVLAAGRFTYQKGFDILVDVWKLVKQNFVSDNWVLKIIGNGEDKNLVRQKVKNLQLDDSIEIIDAVKNIADYYLSASLFVLSSRYEGLPMVLIEAKSYGIPIIAFDCETGPRDLIKNECNGCLIPVGNIQSMADRICDLIVDEEKRKKMGKIARQDAFVITADNAVKKWDKLFESITAN